jgi:hypothetical protein
MGMGDWQIQAIHRAEDDVMMMRAAIEAYFNEADPFMAEEHLLAAIDKTAHYPENIATWRTGGRRGTVTTDERSDDGTRS